MVEIGNCDVRIRADHGKTAVNTEAVSSPPGEPGIGAKNAVATPSTPEKNRGRTEKRVAKLRSVTNIIKITKNSPRRPWTTNQVGNPD